MAPHQLHVHFQDPLLIFKHLSSPSCIVLTLLTQTLCDTKENAMCRSVPELVSPKKIFSLYLLPASWHEHLAALLECCESSRLLSQPQIGGAGRLRVDPGRVWGPVVG